MESTLYAVFLLGAVFRAYRAIVARRILSATIYLACISPLVSAIVYLMGAAQVAVMELSVGAGLVTVLLVYAVSVVGDDALDPASVIPEPLAFGLVGAIALILGIQPASVDIGKRSARGFCGLWLRLCWGLVQPSDTEIPARFRPNHHIHTVSPILIPHPYYKLSQKHACSRHCERSEAIS